MSTTTIRLPLQTGYLDGPYLIIPCCCLCGMKHIHGACTDPRHTVGEYTTRAPHCLNRGHQKHGYPNYVIHIVEDIKHGDKIPGLSRRTKPRDDLPRPPMIDYPVARVGL